MEHVIDTAMSLNLNLNRCNNISVYFKNIDSGMNCDNISNNLQYEYFELTKFIVIVFFI
jgi:hypothetical protein